MPKPPPKPPPGPNRAAKGFAACGFEPSAGLEAGWPKGLPPTPPIICMAARIISGFCIIWRDISAMGFDCCAPPEPVGGGPKSEAKGFAGAGDEADVFCAPWVFSVDPVEVLAPVPADGEDAWFCGGGPHGFVAPPPPSKAANGLLPPAPPNPPPPKRLAKGSAAGFGAVVLED